MGAKPLVALDGVDLTLHGTQTGRKSPGPTNRICGPHSSQTPRGAAFTGWVFYFHLFRPRPLTFRRKCRFCNSIYKQVSGLSKWGSITFKLQSELHFSELLSSGSNCWFIKLKRMLKVSVLTTLLAYTILKRQKYLLLKQIFWEGEAMASCTNILSCFVAFRVTHFYHISLKSLQQHFITILKYFASG